MEVYIQAASALSPQQTFGKASFPEQLVVSTGDRLTCQEPDYKQYIDPGLIRRMSRMIKMGVTTAKECLREAGVEMPDAIITGTAYGCLADTVQFLTRIVEQKEEMLSPTAFIQSTHNTVGGQIALMLGCHGYNNTFVHRGISFESALLDGMLLLEENRSGPAPAPDMNVLVGGVDEITDTSHTILKRFGLYRRTPVSNLDLFANPRKGSLGGEGAAFFILSARAGAGAVRLDGISTVYKPRDVGEIEERITSFLAGHGMRAGDIDLVITGRSGDEAGDVVYDRLERSVFKSQPTIPYKQLCGEYPTSTAFALWYAMQIIRTGRVPPALEYDFFDPASVKRILVYNHYLGIHHSMMLISR